MMDVTRKGAAGFTLIEVMVAMVIALIGSLALGALFIGSMNSDSLAREREAATNLAKRVMEAWVASPTDALPTPDCSPAAAWASTNNAARPNEQSLTCQPTKGLANVSFTVVADKRPVVALLHPNPAGAPAKYQLGPGLRVTAILVDNGNGNNIWAGTDGGGMFESTDGGKTWQRPKGMWPYLTVYDIEQDPSAPAKIWAATSMGLWNNQGIGGIWQPVSPASGLLPSTITAVTFDPVTANTMWAAGYNGTPTQSGVFKSVDGGNTWAGPLNGVAGTTPTQNLTDLTISDLAAVKDAYTDPTTGTVTNTTVLFVATSSPTQSGVFHSVDGAATWSLWGAGNVASHALAVDPAAPAAPETASRVYAATDTGVFRCTTTHAGSPTPVVSCGTTPWLAKSSLGSGVPYSLLVLPGGDVLVGVSRATAGSTMGVYRVAGGGGGTPSLLDGGIKEQPGLRAFALARDPVSASKWYAGTDAGLFVTTNSGAGWTALGGNPAPRGSVLKENGFGTFPKEKVVTVSWQHKGAAHSVTLTHITRRPYAARVLQ